MSLKQHCDGCAEIADYGDTDWILVRRQGAGSLARMFDPTAPEKDPLLGDGLSFHSYDCLRLWLMAKAEAR